MDATWMESQYGNPYIRLPGDRTVTVFRKRGTDQWQICCQVGGKDGVTVYHRGRFPFKHAAIERACKPFGIASRPGPDVDDVLSLKELRARVLGRTRT
jgi:hypothetical protein